MFVLHTRDGNFYKHRPTAKNALWSINLDAEPCPTVAAIGIRNCHISGHCIEYDGEPPPMIDADKPPYRVPLMSEIASIKWNGLTVVSTFAGCGGSSTGYRLAGFRVLLANEFVPIAQESYAANMGPHTKLARENIKDLAGDEILRRIGLRVGELDVLDGSPPCQAFSTAGKREKGWGTEREYDHGAKQKNEDLFDEYIRLLRVLKPRTFVAENVSGLVKGTAKGYFLKILAALKASGYRVEARMLDAQWLGVPQARQRIIFVGVREDLVAAGFAPAFPEPLRYRYSVRDALPWIGRAVQDRGSNGFKGVGEMTDRPSATVIGGPKNVGQFQVEDRVFHSTGGQHRSKGDITDSPSPSIVAGRPASFQVVHATGRKGQPPRDITDEPAPTITAGPSSLAEGGGPRNHFTVQRSVEPETDISGQAIGREYDRLNPGQQSDKYFSLVRADPEGPSPTITAAGGQNSGIACVVHPTEKRKFTIEELKRICAFPDDFVLKGSYGQQWERLGNSVPPVMMFHIASAIRDAVLIPSRAKTTGPGRRSGGRSTKGLSRRGAGTRPPDAAPVASRASGGPGRPRRPGRRSGPAGPA